MIICLLYVMLYLSSDSGMYRTMLRFPTSLKSPWGNRRLESHTTRKVKGLYSTKEERNSVGAFQRNAYSQLSRSAWLEKVMCS